MITLKNVSKRFADKRVLEDISFTLPKGRVTCLLGPSGCGKTTLLRVMAGLLPPDSGTVSIPEGWRASFVFQEDRLMPWYTAMENLTALGISKEAAQTALDAVLLGAEGAALPGDLSGGMQRRLAIARAIAFGWDCFFLDEPMRGLDAATMTPVIAAIQQAISGKTALLITHSPEEALALSDTLIKVDGPPVRLIDSANTSDFTDAEALKQWIQAKQS